MKYLNIYVIDDSPVTRRLAIHTIQKWCEKFNFEKVTKIIAVQSGEEAITLLQGLERDLKTADYTHLLIMDHEMPGKNGYQTASHILRMVEKDPKFEAEMLIFGYSSIYSEIMNQDHAEEKALAYTKQELLAVYDDFLTKVSIDVLEWEKTFNKLASRLALPSPKNNSYRNF